MDFGANIDDSQVEAVVLLSPNFGIANKNAGYALYPWGKQIVRIFSGPYAGFEPVNSEHALYWTERYRTEAVAEVIALVNFCCAEDYAAFRVPSLCVYSEQDKVVSLKRIREQWTEIDPSKEWLYALPASKGHSLAGDVLSPETTSPLVGKITEFLDEVVTLTH